MRNLYYEQVERECDPELLHMHLTVEEVKLLEFSITHIPAIKGNPNTYRLANKFRTFLDETRELESNIPLKSYDKDAIIKQLEYECVILSIAKGSDYSGVKAIEQAIEILQEV